MKTIKTVLSIALVLVAFCTSRSFGAIDTYWTGTGTNNWTNTVYWTPSIPTNGDTAHITNDATVVISSIADVRTILVEAPAGSTGTLEFAAGASLISINTLKVGVNANGKIIQNGGDVHANHAASVSYLYFGSGNGYTATYELNEGWFRANNCYFGWVDNASTSVRFIQTGGTNRLERLYLGMSKNMPECLLQISGGILNISDRFNIKTDCPAEFKVIGGDATIDVNDYYYDVDASNFTHTAVINDTGISPLNISGRAEICGNWVVENDGAIKGVHNLIVADLGITTSTTFNVSFNVPIEKDWSWGIDTNSAPINTLWVKYAPAAKGTTVIVR